jgi:predicted NUDIX family NTP pyrophosphohydrolase
MTSHSAGILLYRLTEAGLLVLLVHPGGPYWTNRDRNAWTIPKGAIESAETPEAAASREFEEETGAVVGGELRALGDIVQAGGKRVTAFACEGQFDPARLDSNLFELEWPPRSGRKRFYPEVDQAEWFTLAAARKKILASQGPLLDRLVAMIETTGR